MDTFFSPLTTPVLICYHVIYVCVFQVATLLQTSLLKYLRKICAYTA
jgi:hypothetical protein